MPKRSATSWPQTHDQSDVAREMAHTKVSRFEKPLAIRGGFESRSGKGQGSVETICGGRNRRVSQVHREAERRISELDTEKEHVFLEKAQERLKRLVTSNPGAPRPTTFPWDTSDRAPANGQFVAVRTRSLGEGPQHKKMDWPKMDWPKLAGQMDWRKLDWPKWATTVLGCVLECVLGCVLGVVADFGQSNLGQSNLGQSISGQPIWPIHFWIWCVSCPERWGPKPEEIGPRRVRPRRVVLEGWGPEGWGPEGWGPEGWAPKGGAKNFALFPLSRSIFALFVSL